MPCYLTGSREGDIRLSLDEARLAATESTRMLCDVLGYATRFPHDSCETLLKSLPPHIAGWWDIHQRIDAERLKRETDATANQRYVDNA